MTDILKTGGSSIILSSKYYHGFMPFKRGKLIKITQRSDTHDEFKYRDIITAIKKYKDYYIIPDAEIIDLPTDSKFSQYLKILLHDNIVDFFHGNLTLSYVDYGGDIDLLDSLKKFSHYLWGSIKMILSFSKHIMKGLKFLHDKQICHLDIKPENIIINKQLSTFKIIDFGYSSKYPFDDFVKDIRGTPSYFPKYIREDSKLGLPKIDANDMILVKGKLPMVRDRRLVYKIDSYCLGRVLNLIYNVYIENSTKYFENNSKQKLKQLMRKLLESDVHKRLTITDILK